MIGGYGRGSAFLPHPPVVKNTSTAVSRADDVKRRDAVYREGLADALKIIRSADTLRNAAQCIEEAMNG